MSASLHWRAIPPPIPDNRLSSDLKFKIRERFWPDSEEHNQGFIIDIRDVAIIGFLDGLVACDVEDAERLRHLVNTHGMIEVWVGDPNGPR